MRTLVTALARPLASAGLLSRSVPREVRSEEPGPDGPPTGLSVLGEALGPAAALRLPGAALRLSLAPRGDGHVVIDIPGWKAPEASGAPLRAYLRHLGHDARGWGFGTNEGHPERDGRRLLAEVLRIADGSGPVSLVGWSLGGIIAREVARLAPDAVRRVVTYGTPVIGGPTHTAGARSYGVRESERIAALAERLERDDPIRVPITALYTRRDGIVAWRACLDRHSPDVEHLEVGSTHLGLGLDPDVWLVVARRLALPASRSAASPTR